MKKIFKFILQKVGIEKSIPTLDTRSNKFDMHTIQVGELSTEQMKKFNLGLYSK